MRPNGSGKTTLLRLLSGRDTPSTGQVLLDGREFSEDDEWVRRQVAVVAEDAAFAFNTDLTVVEHVWLVAAARGAGSSAMTLVGSALDAFRLNDHGLAALLQEERKSGVTIVLAMHHRELAHAVADQATSRIALGLIGRSCTLSFTSANGKDFGQPGLQKMVDISRVSSMLVTSSAAESDK